MVVDKNGFLLAIIVTVAHIYDNKVTLLMRVLKNIYTSIKTVLADGGYRGDIIDTVKTGFGYFLQVVMQKESQTDLFKPVHK